MLATRFFAAPILALYLGPLACGSLQASDAAAELGDDEGEEPQAYGPCHEGCLPNESCVDWWQEPEAAQWCAASCEQDSDCPPAPGGEATPMCLTHPDSGEKICALDCSGGFSCYGGAECFDGQVCTWEP